MERLPTELRRRLILSVGTHRSKRPLSPVEVAEAIELLIGFGSTSREIAADLQFADPSMVANFRRLLRLSPSIRHLVAWGKSSSSIPFSVAYTVARLNSAEAQQQVVYAALENGLTYNEALQLVQILERSQQSLPEAIESVLRLRPQVTRRQVFVGAVLSPVVRSALTRMTQGERDSFLHKAVQNHQPNLPSFSGRLATERFTLVGDDYLAVAMKALPDGFESAVNKCLEVEAPNS